MSGKKTNKTNNKTTNNNSNNKETEEVPTQKASNKITQKAGLTFNVNTVKNKLKEYYDSQGKDTPKFSKGHVGMTAMLECLCQTLLMECGKRTQKNQSGIKQVTRELATVAVRLNTTLNEYYQTKLTKFEKTQMYSDQLPVSRSDIEKVVEKVDTQLTLTPKAHNLVCYLMLCAFLDMATTGIKLLTYTNKKSLDSKCMLTAIDIKFPDGLAHDLSKEVTRACNAVGDDDDEDKDAKPVVDDEDNIKDNDEDNSDDDNTVQETKSKNSKKQQQKNKQNSKSETKSEKQNSKTKQIEQEDVTESDDNDDNDELDKSDEESTKEEPKQKQSKKSNAINNSKKR